jgi:hypothetical protein
MDARKDYRNFPYNNNVYPEKHYWCGFDEEGYQKWYIKLSNGRIINNKDENYFFWLKKYTASEKQTSFYKKDDSTRRN